MRKIVIRMAVGILLLLVALTPLGSVTGRPTQMPPACQSFAFSTEEDFVTQGPLPDDGNPIISDGDLLTSPWIPGGPCVVCARNAELLQVFDVLHDLGLDAADVVDAESFLVAFSTELNSSNPGQFTQGDLLVTNGVIILNQALTARWGGGQGIGHDLGLDAVHFVEDPAQPGILEFLNDAAAQEQPIGATALARLFETHAAVDIWFSTSGTWSPVGAAGFLDGDLLSARSGTIVAANADLLPATVPAGIPSRGVDFGLDAATSDRAGTKEQIHHSTELLFEGEPAFTDGDVLFFNNGVVIPHEELINCFEPRAKFLGLDALHMALEPPADGEIHGKKFHDLNANGALDPEEPGLVRWVIHLDGSGVSEQTTTDASGVYSFTVPAGAYTVREECPDGWYQSYPLPVQGVCGSGIHNITLSAGGVVTDVDFGNYQHINFEGAKFHDLNLNERWDLEEPPLEQWEIHLDGLDGMSQGVNLVEWTSPSGHYTFTVPPGSYDVREVCPPGWAQTVPAPGNGCGSGFYAFAPVSGEPPYQNNLFGNFQTLDLYLPLVLKNSP